MEKIETLQEQSNEENLKELKKLEGLKEEFNVKLVETTNRWHTISVEKLELEPLKEENKRKIKIITGKYTNSAGPGETTHRNPWWIFYVLLTSNPQLLHYLCENIVINIGLLKMLYHNIQFFLNYRMK